MREDNAPGLLCNRVLKLPDWMVRLLGLETDPNVPAGNRPAEPTGEV